MWIELCSMESYFLINTCFGSCLLQSVLRKLRGTIVNIISPPRVLFYRREFYFSAASLILLPRDIFYCGEFYFTTAIFVLLPRFLFYCRDFCFTAVSFIFTTATLIFTTASIILPPRDLLYRREFYFHVKSRGSKIKLAAEKTKLTAVKQNSRQ